MKIEKIKNGIWELKNAFEKMIWLVSFITYQSLLGYFMPKVVKHLWYPIVYGIKMYLYNHFKQLNNS